MNIEEAKKELMDLQSKMSAYAHAIELIAYDEETVAPKGTAANRAHALGILSEEEYKFSTSDETVSLLEFLDAQKECLDCREKRMVELLLKDIRQMQKIPMKEYTAYQELLPQAYAAWLEAKKTDDFGRFCPYLEKIFETNRRFAHYCAPEMAPYDYWLDQFEDGLTMEICDDFFRTLRARIVPLLKKIHDAGQNKNSCLFGRFPESGQEELSLYLMNIMGIDADHCILGTTEHPFTTSIGSHFDERITTHYLPENFASSMFSVIHESGHALYDMGSEDSLAYTVLDGGVSMGIHESQSRFYENLLGRSRPFISFILPKVKELFGTGNPELQSVSAEDFYKAVNRVEPSLIRTEADEVTYCLHVMVRYELEKKAMAGEIAVKDFPAEWNRLYREYLGIDVPDDTHGVLQDSHWAGGSVGYFPSYALGSAYGAQFLKKMKETVDVDGCMASGNFAPINAWNREHIWKYGSQLKPNEILESVLGEPFDAGVYAEYLEKKYSEIYS